MGGHLPYTWGEPGHRVATPTPSILPDVFVSLTEEIRARQAGSTEKFEWTIRAADTTVLSYELYTYNTETASTMEFVLRRGGEVVIPEVRADVHRIHKFLAAEKLHTAAEVALEEEMRPPPP